MEKPNKKDFILLLRRKGGKYIYVFLSSGGGFSKDRGSFKFLSPMPQRRKTSKGEN